MDARYDVIVIGGGPSGSSCATLLARQGHTVLVLEREKFPRFHIGESLTGWAFHAFRKLGVYEELKKINYVQKRGLEFVLPHRSQKVYFPEHLVNEPGELPWSFQMARGKLDKVLLENSVKSGALVKQEHAVTEVLFEGDRAVGVTFRDLTQGRDAALQTAYAQWIIDATGQSGVLNKQFKDNCYNDFLLDDKISVFSHWGGDINIQNNDDELNFKLCVHPNGRDWVWFLPIDKDVVSIGVVVDKKAMKNRTKSTEEIFYEWANETPFIKDFLKNPTVKRIEKFRGVQDYSYRSKRVFGPGWVLTGDSAGFLDPIFSTGLAIGINSAFACADCIHQALELKDATEVGRKFQEYKDTVDRNYRVNSTLVYEFYRCGIDPGRLRTNWRGIEWASPAYALRFLWSAIRIVLSPKVFLHPLKRVPLTWGREVLFGQPTKGNRVADAFLVLAENYETIHRRKIEEATPRMHFIDQET